MRLLFSFFRLSRSPPSKCHSSVAKRNEENRTPFYRLQHSSRLSNWKVNELCSSLLLPISNIFSSAPSTVFRIKWNSWFKITFGTIRSFAILRSWNVISFLYHFHHTTPHQTQSIWFFVKMTLSATHCCCFVSTLTQRSLHIFHKCNHLQIYYKTIAAIACALGTWTARNEILNSIMLRSKFPHTNEIWKNKVIITTSFLLSLRQQTETHTHTHQPTTWCFVRD